MLQRIILYIGLMVCGIVVGKSGKLRKQILERLDVIQLICLLFLLFAMGISMGTNPEVMSSFSTIGFKSILFSIFTITFSIIMVFIFNQITSKLFSGKIKDVSAVEGEDK